MEPRTRDNMYNFYFSQFSAIILISADVSITIIIITIIIIPVICIALVWYYLCVCFVSFFIRAHLVIGLRAIKLLRK
jgi:hypothetical protein